MPTPDVASLQKALPQAKTVSGDLALTVPYGQMSPAQWYAPKVMRFMHEHAIGSQ